MLVAVRLVLPLLPARKNLIRAFQAYVHHLQSDGTGIVSFLTLTSNGFNEFQS